MSCSFPNKGFLYMDSKQIENKLKKNCPKKFLALLNTSIDFARTIHKEEVRPSGDQYLEHGLDTAYRLQEQGFDYATIIASLLHHIDLSDENTLFIKNQIAPEVLDLLLTYNEIDLVIKNTDALHLTITRYLLNYVKDLRPVLIQIANAQSNSHILQSIQNNEERKSIVLRNLNIHSKLAEYLGFGYIQKEITEEAFRITQPEEYLYITSLYEKHNITEAILEKFKVYLLALLEPFSKEIEVEYRIKSKYSTYLKCEKLINEGNINPIKNIKDLIGFRILTNDEDSCYKILEKIWEKGEVLFDEYDDYITHPKPNGYKAMQGPVVFSEISQMPIEVQILSKQMHQYNTYGPASHIVYKESKRRYAKPSDTYNWIEQTQKNINKNRSLSKDEFSIPIDVDIFPNEVYPLTPKKRIIQLNKGDTVTDFAYLVHTDLGNSMIAIKVNGKSSGFEYQPKTGDVIEIITQKGKTHPKAELLNCANSPSTKAKISRAIK